MAKAWRWIRSLFYVVQVYLMMAVIGILFLPWALISARGARAACHCYAGYALWSARWLVGLRTEVRGEAPTDEVLIAAKHQSFLDILVIYYHTPAAKFIMKRELLWTPVIGLYAWRLGCVPVNRGKRGAAIAKMVKDVEQRQQVPGQLIIYSQGTRVKPGVKMPYKIGSGVLYEQLGHPCVPAATNAGLFWPRKGIMRQAGLAVVEFLPRIEPGMPRELFMAHLEKEVEEHSNKLMREAGFDPEA